MIHTWDLFNPTVTFNDGTTVTGTIGSLWLDGTGAPTLVQIVLANNSSVTIGWASIKSIAHD
ncbi:hypothetical protein [Nannocystis pusilla]|uniref:hypothetical protein n=1 Tax=Nannocystis pusilla TaxID=889268 RepID=UPI003DA3F2A1